MSQQGRSGRIRSCAGNQTPTSLRLDLSVSFTADPTLSPSIPSLLYLIKHGGSATQEREAVSTLTGYVARHMWLTINPSLYLDRAALHFN